MVALRNAASDSAAGDPGGGVRMVGMAEMTRLLAPRMSCVSENSPRRMSPSSGAPARRSWMVTHPTRHLPQANRCEGGGEEERR
jgi:hypothetical protein